MAVAGAHSLVARMSQRSSSAASALQIDTTLTFTHGHRGQAQILDRSGLAFIIAFFVPCRILVRYGALVVDRIPMAWRFSVSAGFQI